MAEILMVNKMESVVKSVIDNHLRDYPEICSCDRCKMDMMALTLNYLPPRYVVTPLGDVVTNVDLQGNQSITDVMMAFMRAIEIVKKEPRH